MNSADRRAATVKLLAELDQDEREASVVAASPTSTRAERLRAINYREHFRWAIKRAEKLLTHLEAEQ